MKYYYIVDVVGDGTLLNPYRPDGIESNFIGKMVNGKFIVLVNEEIEGTTQVTQEEIEELGIAIENWEVK